jgi:hypothetical protein
MHASNIYSSLPKALPRELFETLLQTQFFTLECIVSKETPPLQANGTIKRAMNG